MLDLLSSMTWKVEFIKYFRSKFI